MTARSSDAAHATLSGRAPIRRLRSDERGAILALVALLGLVILGLTGTVIDFGLGYIDRARLSRAVDAGVLAGARTLRNGGDEAREQALALAEANGASLVSGASLDVGFSSNAEGENTVWMTASGPRPTFFLKGAWDERAADRVGGNGRRTPCGSHPGDRPVRAQ